MTFFFFLINGWRETRWGLGQVVWIVKRAGWASLPPGPLLQFWFLLFRFLLSLLPFMMVHSWKPKLTFSCFGGVVFISHRMRTRTLTLLTLLLSHRLLLHCLTTGVTAVGSHDHGWDPQKLGAHPGLPPPLICVFRCLLEQWKAIQLGMLLEGLLTHAGHGGTHLEPAHEQLRREHCLEFEASLVYRT